MLYILLRKIINLKFKTYIKLTLFLLFFVELEFIVTNVFNSILKLNIYC